MEIRLLTEETISRIAAGEVIERPVNVVKELVENSIDAGASAITIEIRDGGISLIRVTDNGCGIEKDQISKAFIRHATSKITDANDLSRLSSLGFRGEALASIAAVAQVEMITKVKGEISGTRAVNDHLAAYSPDQPVKIDLEEIGAPNGTTVVVRNLFGSIPVRRRFLRQPQTEAGYVTDLVEKQALSHPQVSFHYRVNGQDKLHTTGNGNLKELIYRIYGRETAGAVIPIHAEDTQSGMALNGFLGKPEVSRSSRSFETFFINGRMLRSKELSAGLEEGYRTDLMQHRFPFAVLHLTMPADQVDVNVHPSKMEVRFTDRRAVYRFLDTSVHNALHAVELIPKASLNTAKEERAEEKKEAKLKKEHLQSAPHVEAFETGRTKRPPGTPKASFSPGTVSSVTDPFVRDSSVIVSSVTDSSLAQETGRKPAKNSQPVLTPVTGSEKPDGFLFEDRRPYGKAAEAGNNTADIQTETEPELPAGQLSLESVFSEASEAAMQSVQDEASRILTPHKSEHYKYIGQIFGTYWLIEYEKRLLIIDQHAAHEKVNYERMMRRIEREHPDLGTDSTAREAAPEDYLALDRLLAREREAKKARNDPGSHEADMGQGIFVASQQLMPPIVMRLSGKEESAYQRFQNVFAAMGYEIEDFGGGTYTIRAVPTELFGQTADSLMREILEEIMEERISGTPRAIISRVASMSCKAAVKGNNSLSETEARALIDELLSLDNPYHCPHGRPTMIVMSQYEMDRKFKRII